MEFRAPRVFTVTLKKILTIGLALFSLTTLTASPTHAQYLPDNDLDREDARIVALGLSNMDEAQFNAVIDEALSFYQPLAASWGATLSVSRLWSDSKVNAAASQQGTRWLVQMYGGMARRPEISRDSFQLVLCHELGHHFGGFVFYPQDNPLMRAWMSNEGQSDYFAAQSCARELWHSQTETNAKFRTIIKPEGKALCDQAWNTTEQRDLCYRVSQAGMELATLMQVLRKETTPPAYDSPDKNEVTKMFHSHPGTQCRLDTTVAAATCLAYFDPNLIPGKEIWDGRNSESAERLAARGSCMKTSGFEHGRRPRCWFLPTIE